MVSKSIDGCCLKKKTEEIGIWECSSEIVNDKLNVKREILCKANGRTQK